MLGDSINRPWALSTASTPHTNARDHRPQNLPAYNPLHRMRASARKGKPAGR